MTQLCLCLKPHNYKITTLLYHVNSLEIAVNCVLFTMADPTSIGSRSAQVMAAAAMSMRGQAQGHMNDTKAKTVLKEAVDAVVNSFAKHTQGYGRGIFQK